MTAPPQKRGIGAVLGSMLLALTVGTTPAGAGPIDEKRAEAAAIAARLEDQAGSIVALDKERRRAQDALVLADTAVARAEDDLALAGRHQTEARRLLAAHAQLAYVGGGSVSFIGRMARARIDDAAARRTYLQIASGEDRLAIGRLRASQEDLRVSQQSLRRARQTAADRTKATEADRARLEQAVGTQRALLGRTNGDLATLVANEQARRDAEANRLVAAAASVPAPARPATGAGPAGGTATPATMAPTATTGGAASAPAPAPSGSVDATFACIRQLESGNNYKAPGGGAYQFQDATWQSLGYKGSAQDAPPAVQDEAARKLQAREGWSPWTTAALCGRV